MTRKIRTSPPAHVIVSYAVENEIDLILMGTHGQTGYERYLLGSVAERVVRSDPISVLTVDLDGRTDAVDVLESGLLADFDPNWAGDSTADDILK